MELLNAKEAQMLSLYVAKSVRDICDKNNIKYYMIGGSLIGAVRNGEFVPWDDDIDFALLRNDYEKFLQVCKRELPSEMYLQNLFTDKGFVYPLTRICLKKTYRKEKYKRKEHSYFYMDIFPIDYIPEKRINQFFHKKILGMYKLLMVYKTCPVLDSRSGKIKNFLKKIVQAAIPGTSMFWKIRTNKWMMKYKGTKLVSSLASKYGYNKQIMDVSVYGKPIKIVLHGEEFKVPQDRDSYLKKLYGDYMTPPEEQEFIAKIYIEKEGELWKKIEASFK